MLEIFVPAFVTLFVTVDPVSIIPIFVSLTLGASRAHKIRMALMGCLIATVLLLLFGLFGQPLLDNFGITLPAFRVAGGILLFLIALEMLFSKRNERKSKSAEEIHDHYEPEDISVFPLAIPLLCGPGAIASIMLLTADQAGNPAGQALVLSAGVVVMLIGAVLLVLAARFQHFIPQTVSNIITRLLGMLLAALSVQFIFDGLKTFFMAG
ncbi:MAG: MarC family protein [Wenzhouxiangella sp.]|nr:MAG: MarC family protein [Wenzhouxiangella sp.]